jgi:MFS family permease
VILNEFGWSRASTAGIFSVNVIIYGITAPFAGALVDRFGPKKVLLTGGAILALATALCSRVNTMWHFYLLFGIAGAIGTSLIGYPANAAVLPHWFVRRRGMAFGIFTSGFGLSFLVVSLVQHFITQFGWRISFILLGIIIAVILLPLITLFSRHRPQDIGLFPDGAHPLEKVNLSPDCPEGPVVVDKKWANTNWTLRKAMRTYRFWLLFFTSFCIFGFVESLVVVHQVVLMRDVGFSRAFITSIVALWGIMIALGNLGGFLSDKIGREKTFNIGCLASVVGLFMLLLLEKSSHSWILYLYTVSFGLGMGVNGPALGAALADTFQGKNFGSINGFFIFGFGLGGIVGPWFAGFIFDTTKSYSIALIVTILVTCLAFILLWIAAPRKIRKIS